MDQIKEPVTLYTTPSCGYCRMAKDFFQANNIQYQEKDVAIDSAAREEMLNKSDQLGVPVIEIGENILIGFNQPKLRELLDL